MDWEYQTVGLKSTEGKSPTDLLNQHGQKGWELVAIVTQGYDFFGADAPMAIFKRQRPQKL